MKTRGIKKYCKENGIELLVLFGSSADSKSENPHDTDLAVKLTNSNKISKLQLIYGLDDFAKGSRIDLVLLTADTAPLLLHEIFSNGKCLYENKKGVFDKERLRAWKLYLDTEKIRIAKSRYLKKFTGKVSHVA